MKYAKSAPKTPWRTFAVALGVVAVLGVGVFAVTRGGGSSGATSDDGESPTSTAKAGSTTTTRPPYAGWVDPESSQERPETKTPGLLTFRGSPTRSWYGLGPIPSAPQVLWAYPKTGGMCSVSTDGSTTSTWCGDGWTGQPNVYERDGRTIGSFGGYDASFHWVDATTGDNVIQPFKTGDLAKGSITTDPDGYPLTYKGSRDNYFYIVATDRGDRAEVLWKLGARDFGVQQVWNDDWDGSALVIDDYLFQGGENSNFYIFKLNRQYDAAGKVQVDPQLVFTARGWDQELANVISDRQFSIENSVAISGNTLYFANSSGLVQGWDISGIKQGQPATRVFRFWTGDDTDATITIDKQGMLYVGSEWERFNERSKQVGQMMKLDPSKPDNPLVWSIKDQGASKAGVWATPALGDGIVYFATNAGRLIGADMQTGAIVWEKNLRSQTWGSPVVVDKTLIEGDCQGNLNAYDISDPRIDPPLKWTVKLNGCIEATPAVWKGRIYVATRGGQMYAIGDR
ncbi:MAG: PQQ-binding-like beta-propeller repeat protein [Acidimicrobiia bacterium]